MLLNWANIFMFTSSELIDYLFFQFSEKAKRPLSNDYYISADVSHFILSHTNLIHLGATTIPPKKSWKKYQKKNPEKNISAKIFPDLVIFILPSFSHQFFFPALSIPLNIYFLPKSSFWWPIYLWINIHFCKIYIHSCTLNIAAHSFNV